MDFRLTLLFCFCAFSLPLMRARADRDAERLRVEILNLIAWAGLLMLICRLIGIVHWPL